MICIHKDLKLAADEVLDELIKINEKLILYCNLNAMLYFFVYVKFY